MATYRTSNAGGGTTGTGNRTATISAQAGDHLTVYVKWSGNNNTSPTCTDDQSGTYDLVLTALNNGSADIMAIFVRQQRVQTTATITVAPVVGSGTNTAGEIVIVAVTGMTRMGANSIRQSAKQENQTTGVPTPVLGASALTGNLTVTVAGSTTTAGAVPNASWTERQDVSQSSPVTAIEVATRDSGFTGTSAAYVSIASGVWSSAILEFDTTVPDFAYFDKEQWPVPEKHKAGSKGDHSISLRTWLQGDMPLLRGPEQVPFVQEDWPNPRAPLRSKDLLKWRGSLAIDSGYDTLRSPLFTRIESRGFPISLRHWDQGNLLNTLNATTPPIPPVSSYILRSPSFNKVEPRAYFGNRGQDPVNLLGTLLGPTTQAPFSVSDWPVPRGAQPSIDLRTWLERYKLELIGQDTLPFPNRDWPNPRGAVPAVDLRTWLENTTYLIGKDSFFGLAGHPTFDWPNPRGPEFPTDLRTLAETITYLIGKDQLPTLNYDWPNPRGPIPPIDLRTWLERYKLELIGQDALPFFLTEWPNPRGKQPPTLTWDHGDLLNTLYNILVPFAMSNWPVPMGSVPSVVLKTWLDEVKLNLLGKDQFFGLAGHPNFSWPNPPGYPSLVPPLIGPTNPNLLPPTPVTAEQLRQIIRFAPLAFGGRTHWTR